MAVIGLDHVAFPTEDVDRLLAFYKALGFGVEHEEAWREGRSPVVAVTFGDNKLNIHPPGLAERITLRGPSAQPGCADLCFVWDEGLDALLALLERCGVPVEEGPVRRIGGRGAGTARGTSVYVRDPDRNLLEFICYS
jgi:catechol 2,3-dioxygenase-like lactoylglutathione lyase family enzyme